MTARLEAHRPGEYTTMCSFSTGERWISFDKKKENGGSAVLHHSII